MATAGDQRYMRLRPEFLAGFDWRRAGVRRQEFAEWARKKRDPPLRVDERNWTPLKAGQPVPWEMVEALSEYLIAVLKLKGGKDSYRLVLIAENADAPQEPAPVPESGLNAWRLNFLKLFTLKTEAFTVPHDAYCRDERDIMDAAVMIMHAVGYRETKSASRDACLEHAARMMKRTPAEYARLLLDGWKANENAVLFTLQRQPDGASLRAGVSVVIPVSKGYYRRFRDGATDEMEATPADMPANSLFLLMDAVAENHEMDIRQEKGRRSMDQAGTVLYQFASLCPSLNSWSANPTTLCFGGDGESVQRLKSYHYKEVGTLTKLTGRPVMEFAPPSRKRLGASSPIDLAHYLAMKSTLLIYQYINGKQVLPDD